MRPRSQDEIDMYTTDKFVTKWDRLYAEPADVYADRGFEWSDVIHDPDEELPEFGFNEGGLGEKYPRGV